MDSDPLAQALFDTQQLPGGDLDDSVLAGWLNIRPMFALTAVAILALALLVGRKSRAWY